MDKTALITGAARRIGATSARALHALGYRVAINYNTSVDAATTLVDSLNSERADSAICVQGDLAQIKTAQHLIDKVDDAWGRLDLLVNNASIYEPTAIENPDPTQFERIIATNLRAPYLLSAAAVPMLRATQGSIVNLTDVYGLRPQAGYPIYCTSKAGLIGLTKSLARELAPEVRVNGISPGPIVWGEEHSQEHRDEVLGRTPLGRIGAPTDIANAVCYLANAAYVTGQIMEVDGGQSIYI